MCKNNLRDTIKTLYYANSRRYLWHYPFVKKCSTIPMICLNLIKNYNPTNRKYILGTFNYNSITGNYFLEFAVCDNPSDAQIDELVEKVKATFFLGAKLKFYSTFTILLRRKTEIAARHQVLSSNDLFKSRSYQPICRGRTSGILRWYARKIWQKRRLFAVHPDCWRYSQRFAFVPRTNYNSI